MLWYAMVRNWNGKAFIACTVHVTDVKQLEHQVTNVFMKLLNTNSTDFVEHCQTEFCFRDESDKIAELD